MKVPRSAYKCPICLGDNTDYSLEELLQHASEIGRGIQVKSLEDRASHLSLEKFLNSIRKIEIDDQKLFVYPCQAIVANIPIDLTNGKKLRYQLKEFDPIWVSILYDGSNHPGFAIMEFKKNLEGVGNAIKFEKMLEVNNCGKKDYYNNYLSSQANKFFGWLAWEDDYYSKDIVGINLRRKGNLRSLSSFFEDISFEYINTTLKLESEGKSLDHHDQQLLQRQLQIEREKRNLLIHKRKNKEEVVKLEKSYKNILSWAEGQKLEKENSECNSDSKKSPCQIEMLLLHQQYLQDQKDRCYFLESDHLMKIFVEKYRDRLKKLGAYKSGAIEDYKSWHKENTVDKKRKAVFITKLDFMTWDAKTPEIHIVPFCVNYNIFVMDECPVESMLKHPVVLVYYDHCNLTPCINNNEPWVKGTFDGSLRNDKKDGGAAGAIRLGNTLVGTRLMHIPTPGNVEDMEIAGAYCVVTLAVKQGISKLEIMGDSMYVINVLRGVESPKPEHRAQFGTIFSILESIEHVRCRWEYRQANTAADELAKQAILIGTGEAKDIEMGAVEKKIQRDGSGRPYYRVVQEPSMCPLCPEYYTEGPGKQGNNIAGLDEKVSHKEAVKYTASTFAREGFLRCYRPPFISGFNGLSMAGNNFPRSTMNGSTFLLQHVRKFHSQEQQSSCLKRMLKIDDELNYLITKGRTLPNDLFMLPTFPSSRCVANAIDLAGKPMVMTFRAYSKDQIIGILQERLMVSENWPMEKFIATSNSVLSWQSLANNGVMTGIDSTNRDWEKRTARRALQPLPVMSSYQPSRQHSTIPSLVLRIFRRV